LFFTMSHETMSPRHAGMGDTSNRRTQVLASLSLLVILCTICCLGKYQILRHRGEKKINNHS